MQTKPTTPPAPEPSTMNRAMTQVAKRTLKAALSVAKNQKHLDLNAIHNRMVERAREEIPEALDSWNKETSGTAQAIAVTNALSAVITDLLIMSGVLSSRLEERLS